MNKTKIQNQQESDQDRVNTLLDKSLAGDNDSLGELIVMLEPLIAKSSRHYWGYTDDDLMQLGRIRCIVLIKRYDSNYIGVKFLGYIKRMLGCYFWDIKKSELNKGKTEIVSLGEESEIDFFGKGALEPGFVEIELEDMLSMLPVKEKYIIKENVMYGRKLKQVARELGISYDYSKELKKKSLLKLKEIML